MNTPSGPPTTASAAAPRRRTLPRALGYALAAYLIGLSLFSAVAPSPLYRTYSELWQLSAVTVTLIYATYAFGVLVTLLFAGSISDDVGRRPVLLAALLLLLLSTVLFVFASPAVLFVARGLQGLATGAVISTAGAALLDLHPRRDPGGVGLANGVASSAGIALGILAVSALVHLDVAPLVLPFLLLAGLLVVALAGAYWMPEPVSRRGRLRLRLQRPHVPPSVRGPFLLATLTTVASWSLGGLNFSLGPALGAALFGSADPLVQNVGIVALAITAALSQVALRRIAPWLGAGLGSAGLAVGVSLIVLASIVNSGPVYLLGSAISGVGFGVGFLGGLRALMTSMPAAHRASVLSAFYIVAYASLSVPAVLAGIVVGRVGLLAAFEGFGFLVAVLALASALVAWNARPGSGRRSRGVAPEPL